MTLQANGPISMDQINAEFGRGNNLNSYRGTVWYLDNGNSGLFEYYDIDFAEFYSKRNGQPTFNATLTGDITNLDLRAWLVSVGWNQTLKAFVTVAAGARIYSTSVGTPAILIQGSFPQGVALINNGWIMGKGGHGGWPEGPTAEAGGDAISVTTNDGVTIQNNQSNGGVIGGGGGGGAGGRAPYVGTYHMGGGGAGGGNGGGNPTIGGEVYGLGGAIGNLGTNGVIGGYNYWGGGGGRQLNGAGGAAAAATWTGYGAPVLWPGQGGGAGGSGSVNMYGYGTCYSGAGGSYGNVGGNGGSQPYGGGGGGGGGFGASGGSSGGNPNGGPASGGYAVRKNGNTVNVSGTLIYGAVG